MAARVADVAHDATVEKRQTSKDPFDIHEVMDRVRETVRSFPKAALFELAEEGYASPFQQLVACILSIRTRDEVTLPTARRLFEVARTAGEMTRLTAEEIDALIGTCSFHEPKARQIRHIADRVVTDFDGELPCDEEIILSFPGVGPKCANLTLGIACGQSRVSVDVHVHRVTNRWGYVRSPTPERTMLELEQKLPAGYRVEINRLLVPFGKHVCTGSLPKCSTCPVLNMCRQVGVESHR
jgi:endonuclease-3